MYAVDTEAERQHLEAVAGRHGRQPITLFFVESVGEWAKHVGIQNSRGNPQGMACATPDGGAWIVALRRIIDPIDVESQITMMECRGFANARDQLNCAKSYAEHLLLHELAHLTNNWNNDNERGCDAWAFDRMSSSAI
jgi:hypothetical protein